MDELEENIENLVNFGVNLLDRHEIKQLLLNNNNNVEIAVNKYFDSMASDTIITLKNDLRNSNTPAKWDETAFEGAGYGADDGNIPTFNIDYAPGIENYPHSVANSAAPTRPNSRTSNASTQAQAGDAPIQSIEGQESGVTGSNPHFGPATREQYDNSWALVPTTSSTEVIADPVPSQRKREPGQPAILKPSSNFNYLSTLIPILHSIPLFRNALLCPGLLQNNYWAGDDWWKGSPAETSRIIEIGRSEAYGRDILYEAQRLMAFLDKTDRIYGSVDAMLKSDAWRELQPPVEDPDDDVVKFLMSWGFALQSHVPDVELDGVLRSTFEVGGSIRESYVLDAYVTRDKSRPDLSLYDALDDALFSSAAGSAHIRDISNVLIFRLTSSNTEAANIGCRIPATLYVDRYLEANKAVIDSMRTDMEEHEEELRGYQRQAERTKYHTPNKAGAKRLDSLQMLKASMTAYEPPVADESSENAAILSHLTTLYNNIERKLATLEQRTQQVQKTIAGISGRFKPHVDNGAEKPLNTANDSAMDTTEDAAEDTTKSATGKTTTTPVKHTYPEGQKPDDAMNFPYKLQGVATRRDVVYLLQPNKVTGAKQWWRMQYDSESANPIIRRDQLSLEEVIERATTESASALLVYANDDAMKFEPTPLPEPLETFVKKDNLNFLQELQSNLTGWETYGNDFGNVAQGGWDHNPSTPDATSDFELISADEFHNSEKKRERINSNLSSATLTPNTEIDDAPEMVEKGRRASSETVGRGDDAMEVDGKGKVSFTDVDMEDVAEKPRTQHIEVAEKKGG